MKLSWFSANLLSSLVLSYDSGANSDEFTANISDGTVARQWQGCKCVSVSIMFAGDGRNGVLVRMDFIGIAAEADVTTATTFGTAYSIDGGTGIGVNGVDFGITATATGVRMCAINLAREQLPDYNVDGTVLANSIESNRFFASITLQQNPGANTIPGTGQHDFSLFRRQAIGNERRFDFSGGEPRRQNGAA